MERKDHTLCCTIGTAASICALLLFACSDATERGRKGSEDLEDTLAALRTTSSEHASAGSGANTAVPLVHERSEQAVHTERVYRFADRKMFEIERYQSGKKHGIQLLYDLNTSGRPKYLSFFEDGVFVWGVYPSADVDYTLEHGIFVKGIALGVDSAMIRAPFDSTAVWYEGLFVRVDGLPVPIGLHRVYDEQGVLRMELDYATEADTSAIGGRRPLRVRRSGSR